MKVGKLLIVCVMFFSGLLLLAQDENSLDIHKVVELPGIQQQLASPDGAAMFLNPDGSMQLFGRGTGTYDFDDVDDINDARREASMKAKAALVKFMKENVSVESGFLEAAEKTKTISSDGEKQTSNISKESSKKNYNLIRTSANELLQGVITLKEQKIPRKGNSGEIQVTVGVSSKTLEALGRLNEALDAVPQRGQSRQNNQERQGANPATNINNKAEVREAATDF